MKNTFIILCLISAIFFGCKSQNRIMKSEIAVNDTIFNFEKNSQRAKEKLQIAVNLFIKEKIFSFKNEDTFSQDLLMKKEDVEAFAKNLIHAKYPQIKNLSNEYYLGEDNSKKLWFIYTEIPNTFDGGIYMVIVKNNCKVLYFDNFCCPR